MIQVIVKELGAETRIGKSSIKKNITEYNSNKTVTFPNITKSRTKIVDKMIFIKMLLDINIVKYNKVHSFCAKMNFQHMIKSLYKRYR